MLAAKLPLMRAESCKGARGEAAADEREQDWPRSGPGVAQKWPRSGQEWSGPEVARIVPGVAQKWPRKAAKMLAAKLPR